MDSKNPIKKFFSLYCDNLSNGMSISVGDFFKIFHLNKSELNELSL